jgi:DNA-binding transcriptional ArsR family regulator
VAPQISRELNGVFGALADPTRRGILARLALEGDTSTLALAEPLAMSLPAVSKHLGVLERAGLIERRLEGRERRCRLVAGPLRDAFDWLSFYQRFWALQLDRLEAFLGKTPPRTAPRKDSRWTSSSRPPRTASPSRASSRRRPSASSRPGRRRR